MLFARIFLGNLVLFRRMTDARYLAQRDSAVDLTVDRRSELFANLQPRALSDSNGQPSCRPVCGSCGSSCSAAAASKRNLLEFVTFNGTVDDELLGAEHLGNANSSLFKRTFKNVRQSTIGTHFKDKIDALVTTRQNPNTNLINLIYSTKSNDYTFAALRDFSNFDSDILNIGVKNLTGCTVLTVVSRRAVYMAHFFENLAFRPDGREAPDTAFQQNCLNLITGQGKKWKTRGDSLDPSLFTGGNGPAIAYIMTPRQDQDPNSPVPGPETQYFPGRMEQLSQTLTSLIPGLGLSYYNYIAMGSEYHKAYQGKALFEYDPNADGLNNANFRLFYEQTMQDGRAAGIIT
ncbi:hypothetical protein F5Y10DRAFT_286255 [Nemania abortiva]|nr:hypothetical protein F5Y10DRAFT_286255 [Nemania abortiva]